MLSGETAVFLLAQSHQATLNYLYLFGGLSAAELGARGVVDRLEK